jgi:hypothetical protein
MGGYYDEKGKFVGVGREGAEAALERNRMRVDDRSDLEIQLEARLHAVFNAAELTGYLRLAGAGVIARECLRQMEWARQNRRFIIIEHDYGTDARLEPLTLAPEDWKA